jgi:hypothetical protein
VPRGYIQRKMFERDSLRILEKAVAKLESEFESLPASEIAFGFHWAGKARGVLESAVRLRRMSIYKTPHNAR